MSKQPLSVEELIKKQQEAAAFKPKFLSKAERLKQAQEKKEAEEKERKAKEERDRKEREEFERKAREEARLFGSSGRGAADDHSRYGRNGRDRRGPDDLDYGGPQNLETGSRSERGRNPYDRYNDRDRDAPTGPRGDQARLNGRDLTSSSRVSTNGSSSNGDGSRNGVEKPVTEAEQALIRQRYLGVKEIKKRPKKKLSDKKFVFDWAQEDDTSDKINPVYESSLEASVFGAGGRAGMDPTERSRNGLNLPKRGAKSAFDEKHWSEKTLDEMKERDWRIFREDFAIAARGGHIPHPLRSWKESTIPAPILAAIQEIGYAEPSPIQRQAIPIGLQNRDLIGIAETGSGKTASFVIPMLSYISELPRLSDENRHLGPYALILAPTRELAQQIEGEAKKFSSFLGYTCVSIVGGRDMNEQAFNLRDGAEIVIATPGRLKDCIERHVLVLSQCTYVVMDEADRMINLGFEDVVNYILDSLPVSNLKPDTDDSEDPLRLLRKEGESKMEKYRVTMLYSATMPPSVERMARKYLRRPATITIGEANQAVGTVEQRVEFINSDEKKKSRLLQILNSGFEPPIIVFVNQKKMADQVGRDIQRAGWNPAILHSGKTQSQREVALEDLRSGECPILVATDLAGRGIDVPDVSLVINYQMSNHIEAYVHRIGESTAHPGAKKPLNSFGRLHLPTLIFQNTLVISLLLLLFVSFFCLSSPPTGRTGRAGKTGVAITFLEAADEELYYDLKQEISKSPVSKLPSELARHPAAQTKLTKEMKRKRGQEDDG
ncbi:DEAD-domain-containing protein [Violaceomyces palustris]|uniref:DEAD-domain-containing protein n=1 Tax=Violaceomyces palustris TaxID=1673888 RepID=A0ACD0P1S2_9BASI|nr:DEAD-domain-containing protein [Violaceomyces palustris]